MFYNNSLPCPFQHLFRGEGVRRQCAVLESFPTFCQFHQHFKSSFFHPYSFAKKIQIQITIRKAGKTFLYIKAASKMLAKLTPGVGMRNGEVQQVKVEIANVHCHLMKF